MSKEILVDPIEAILFRMDQMGWTAADLAREVKMQKSHVNEYLTGRRKITLNFIRRYHSVADATPLEVLIQDYEPKKRKLRKEYLLTT